MNTKNSLLALAAFAAASVTATAGTFADITLDGSFSDWDGIAASFTDAAGDGTPGDINQIFLANNDTHLFIRVTFNTEINPNAGSPALFIGIDNDSNAATGFDVYSLGLLGTEAGWQNDFPFEQATGSFNTGATTSGAAALISLFNTSVTSQEISIARNAIIDVENGQLVFPNSSFNIGLYFNEGTVDDFAGPAAYTFATAIPEPSTFGALAGLSVLGLAATRRRRK